MVSRKQIARALAGRLMRAPDYHKEARWLALTIDRLIYSSNRKKLNIRDKEELADLICDSLCDGRSKKFNKDEALALTNYIKSFWKSNP